MTAPEPGQDAAHWSDSVLVWNGVVASIPALVVQRASPSELRAAIAFAREHGLPLRIGRGGPAGERCLTVDLSDKPPSVCRTGLRRHRGGASRCLRHHEGVGARLYAATGESVARLDEAGNVWDVELSLVGTSVVCLAVDPRDSDTAYAGLGDDGVRKTSDGGRSWAAAGLEGEQVFSVAVSAADGAVYAGTEPSALYRSDDGGETWRALEGLLELPSRPSWSFPPRPWTSHVRWIAPSPHHGDVVLAGIELGGLMRSTDGGETWQDQRPGSQPDVHSLSWHPRVGGRAYEAGGGGAAWSEDGGDTWQPADDGRDRHYTWSVAVDPADPELWYVSASTGPHPAHGRRGDPQARIFRRNGGGWEALDGGLPDPLPAMPYALVATDERLFAGLANGELWESLDRGDSWERCRLSQPLSGLLALVEAR